VLRAIALALRRPPLQFANFRLENWGLDYFFFAVFFFAGFFLSFALNPSEASKASLSQSVSGASTWSL
jgi:hypothetical protein